MVPLTKGLRTLQDMHKIYLVISAVSYIFFYKTFRHVLLVLSLKNNATIMSLLIGKKVQVGIYQEKASSQRQNPGKKTWVCFVKAQDCDR